MCHGDRTVSSGLVADLRKTGVFPDEAWFPIVQDGILKSRGMVAFGQHLNREQIEKIRSYVLHESDYWYQELEKKKAKYIPVTYNIMKKRRISIKCSSAFLLSLS